MPILKCNYLFPQAPFDSDFNLLRVFDGFGNSEDPLIRTNDKPLSTTVSPKSFCLAVEAAGFASSSLDLKDLESQPANEIYECLEILANLEWSDRPGFWNLIKDKIVSSNVRFQFLKQIGAD